jgi:hypothetical protein
MSGPTPSSPEHTSGSAGGGGHPKTATMRLKFELALLLSIFAGLSILAFRPFGFRTFLSGISHNEIYSMMILVGIVAVIFVIMQRLGMIFDNPSYTQ